METLAAGIEHKDREIIASKAKQTLAQKQRYGSETGASALTVEQVRQRLRVFPKGEKLSDALVQVIQKAADPSTHSASRRGNWQERRCLATDVECLVWMIDLNSDGRKEAVVIIAKPEWESGTAIFYRQTAEDQFEYGGTLNLAAGADKKQRDKYLADIERGDVKTVAPRFNDLMIGGRRISVIPAGE